MGMKCVPDDLASSVNVSVGGASLSASFSCVSADAATQLKSCLEGLACANQKKLKKFNPGALPALVADLGLLAATAEADLAPLMAKIAADFTAVFG